MSSQMSETSFYQRFHIKRVSRFMTKIKEKTSIHFGTKTHTSSLPVSLVDTTREIIQVKQEPSTLEPSEYVTSIPSSPQISSLPPPPRYTQKYRHKPAHLKDKQNLIQTRSNLTTSLALPLPPPPPPPAVASTSKPYLCRSNTLGHPSTPNISPLDTPDQHDHSPISTASERIGTVDYFKLQDDQVSLLQRWRNDQHHSHKPLSAPEDTFSLDLYPTSSLEYEKADFDVIVSNPQLHNQSPYINVISRTPSLINFPDSPSSSISRV